MKNLIPLPPKKPVPSPPENKYTRREILDLEAGRAPPQAMDLEQVIIGALLIDNKGMPEIANIMSKNYFANPDHGIIYEVIESLYQRNIAIDLLTVSEELRRIDKLGFVGGPNYLIGLTERVSSSAHIEFHCRIVIQKYILRRLIHRGDLIISDAYSKNPDVFDIMDAVQTDIDDILANVVKSQTTKVLSAKEELRSKVEAVMNNEPPGVYTGLEEFDEWCGGFQKRELITIAARPGMGKTTGALSIVSNASYKKNIPTAFFSLEMAENDIKNRLAARGTGISYDKIRLGKLTIQELNIIEEYYDFIDKNCLHIVDKTVNLNVIVKKCRELVEKHGVKLIMIDYVQLIKLSRSSGDRTSDLSTITRDLKSLANELNIPIIIMAQLSRGVDDRPSKRPKLSDLKQSGSIEEDSDTVIFLLRMAYYDKKSGIDLPPNVIGKTELIVAKGRNTGTKDFWTFMDFNTYDWRSFA